MKCSRIGIGLLGGLLAVAGQVMALEPGSSVSAARPRVTFVIHEDEYKADQSLPPFAKFLAEKHGCRTTLLLGSDRGIEGLDALKTTDVMVLFVRRKVLPQEQLDAIRAYLDAGRGLVALRTSCHAFATAPWSKKPQPVGAQWQTFDADVLGCHYTGHYANQAGTQVTVPAEAAGHPILAGLEPRDWHSTGSLYKILPLTPDCKVLMNGKFEEHVEPVTWTRTYKNSRVFSTTLGHVDDFAQPQFRRMLVQAITWAAGK